MIVALTVLTLAIYRLTRLVVVDDIMAPARDWVWGHYPPNTFLGYLLTCMWCVSIWTASLVVICFTIVPTATFIVSFILAASAVTGLIDENLDS